jgi:hypothetical protein
MLKYQILIIVLTANFLVFFVVVQSTEISYLKSIQDIFIHFITAIIFLKTKTVN